LGTAYNPLDIIPRTKSPSVRGPIYNPLPKSAWKKFPRTKSPSVVSIKQGSRPEVADAKAEAEANSHEAEAKMALIFSANFTF